MRSLAFLFVLSLQAQPPQALEKIKQFAADHLESLSCNQVEPPSNSKTITVELVDASTPRHGIRTSIDTRTLFQDVFAFSSGTDFEFDHRGMIRGQKMAVYRYSNQINGKTHAGVVFADENTGAISRIIFRATDTTAHLFCTAQ